MEANRHYINKNLLDVMLFIRNLIKNKRRVPWLNLMSFHSVLLGTRFESLAAVAQVKCKNNWQIGITKQWVTAKEEEINLVSSLV